MKEFTITADNAGKKLIRTLTNLYPEVPAFIFQKALRNKDIMLDGKRTKNDCVLQAGQVVRLYIKDKEFELAGNLNMAKIPNYSVVYEDNQLLLVNKPQELTVHPGRNTPPNSTLIEKVRQDYKNDQITLCHRLDRNTGGLVLLAKTKVALGKITEVLNNQQLVKRYRCLVKGIPEAGKDVFITDGDTMKEIKAYWEKPNNSDSVFVHNDQRSNDLQICTRYRILQIFTDIASEPISELEVELVTGRTHQIRAHLAHLGHPIIGDGKYGRNEFNLQFQNRNGGKVTKQQLFATTLMFGDDLPNGLQELKRRSFKIEPAYTIKGIK